MHVLLVVKQLLVKPDFANTVRCYPSLEKTDFNVHLSMGVGGSVGKAVIFKSKTEFLHQEEHWLGGDSVSSKS